tara:strand:+ start:192 stop:521 length:330 start_codon:yes stop_codon:yes gene_type:complete
MLRIIIIILLCSILVYSKNNTLKGIAIFALLLQAYYDTRPKKEKFMNMNMDMDMNMNNVLDNTKMKELGIQIGEVLYEDKNSLTKQEFLNKIKSPDFISKITYKLIKLL